MMQVLFNDFGLAHQVGNMLFDHFDQALDSLDLLLEFIAELLLLLIAPRFAQSRQLPPEQVDAGLHVVAKLLQILRKLPQFFGIDNSLWHEKSPKSRILFQSKGFFIYSNLEIPAIQAENASTGSVFKAKYCLSG
jgi:hypothetical protein